MHRVSTFAVLIAMVFYFVSAPAVSHGFPSKPGKDSGVCRLAGKKECRHSSCRIHKDTTGHRHADSTHASKVFFKCGCAGDGALHPASFHETVFILPDTGSLRGLDGISSATEYTSSFQKDPSFPIEIPPRLIAPSYL